MSGLEDNCDFIVKDIVLRPSVVNYTILRTTVGRTVVYGLVSMSLGDTAMGVDGNRFYTDTI